MRLCLASYGGRLAALFENATEFPCYELDREAAPVYIATFMPTHRDPCMRLAALREQNVRALVCGGICRRLAVRAESSGLQVVPWICGDNETVLAACMDGTLAQLAMPGCRWTQGAGIASDMATRPEAGDECPNRNRLGRGGSGRRAYDINLPHRSTS
ncbi:hypothetical protein DPQ33_10525 [Oceanidesulfovibrio indonesiensis]|uniref:Dinitrogenase iron-molybdenum cofactor biosynthesis domain-containing protein n=1 Tax=Oceanidesulfovibrio indonesiensis TaxID=54767 RepID=A0A7M3MDP1_9BACT|nr:hypothetical protein [Oceanidesulfovibrio indonesiensis]TVM16841.1 hypothetical protein DPQ33_10525 [Oceanidesulfovibrio indonesiensis]